MEHIFDTNTLSSIFMHYYFDNFPSFWKKFNQLVKAGKILSVSEVRRELKEVNRWVYLEQWAVNFPDFFEKPTNEELIFITEIYSVKHFQQNVELKKRLGGKPVADPFVIAKAKIKNAIVVTEEEEKPNSVKIPNICNHFQIKCVNLEKFLVKENWKF
ncbi:MAG: PIN domain-containing protein [Candidatus Zixiibacteriota bacterium]